MIVVVLWDWGCEEVELDIWVDEAEDKAEDEAEAEDEEEEEDGSVDDEVVIVVVDVVDDDGFVVCVVEDVEVCVTCFYFVMLTPELELELELELIEDEAEPDPVLLWLIFEFPSLLEPPLNTVDFDFCPSTTLTWYPLFWYLSFWSSSSRIITS